jgi:hypothetical protein
VSQDTHRADQGERHLLLRTEAFFGQKPPSFVFAFGVAFVVVVGVLDYQSWYSISFGLFYLMPIGLVTWHLGRRAGAFMVVIAAATGLYSDIYTSPSSGLIPYWNGAVRLGVYLVLAALLATLKDSIQLQRTVAMHEHDVVRPVEQPDLFHGGKRFVRPIHAGYDSHYCLPFRITGAVSCRTARLVAFRRHFRECARRRPQASN